MIVRERTRQQLDPAGTSGVRLFTVALSFGAVIIPIVITMRSLREIVDPALAIVSFVFLAVAALVMVIASSPLRAPLTRLSHQLVMGSALISYLASAASTMGQDAFVRDDWGAYVLGAFLIALCPYRPGREIAVAGIISAIFVGFITLVQVRWFAAAAPPFAFVIVAVAPLLAMCFGAFAYSMEVSSSIERWQRRAREANRGHLDEVRGTIARSVQQDRVTILGRDVLPFFATVLERGGVTDSDRERARELSRSIRDVMVAEAERTWLQNLVIRSGLGGHDVDLVVDDRDGLATSMSTEQRTSLRALLVALVQTPEFEPQELRIRIVRDGELCRAAVAARFGGQDSISRIAFWPYLALLRAAFNDLDVEFDHPTLRLRFWYD